MLDDADATTNSISSNFAGIASPDYIGFDAKTVVNLPTRTVQVGRLRVQKTTCTPSTQNLALSDVVLDISASNNRFGTKTDPISTEHYGPSLLPQLSRCPQTGQGNIDPRLAKRAGGFYGYSPAISDFIRAVVASHEADEEAASPPVAQASNGDLSGGDSPNEHHLLSESVLSGSMQDQATTHPASRFESMPFDRCSSVLDQPILSDVDENMSQESWKEVPVDRNAANLTRSVFQWGCPAPLNPELIDAQQSRDSNTNDAIIEDIVAMLNGSILPHGDNPSKGAAEDVELRSTHGSEAETEHSSELPTKVLILAVTNPVKTLTEKSSNSALPLRIVKKCDSPTSSIQVDYTNKISQFAAIDKLNAANSLGGSFPATQSGSPLSGPSACDIVPSPAESLDSPMPATPTIFGGFHRSDPAAVNFSIDGLGINKPTSMSELMNITACPDHLFQPSCGGDDDFFTSFTFRHELETESMQGPRKPALARSIWVPMRESWTGLTLEDCDDHDAKPISRMNVLPAELARSRDASSKTRTGSVTGSFTSGDFYTAASSETESILALSDIAGVRADDIFGTFAGFSSTRRRPYSMPGAFAGNRWVEPNESIIIDESCLVSGARCTTHLAEDQGYAKKRPHTANI